MKNKEVIEPENPEYTDRMKELGLACPKKLDKKGVEILHDYQMSITYNPETKKENRKFRCKHCGEPDYEETEYED